MTFVVPVTVAVVPPSLVLALELVVEHDAPHAPAAVLDGACRVLVGAVDVHVVFELARAPDAGVEGLRAFVPGRAVRLEEAAARRRQPDCVIAGARDPRGLDEPLLAQVAQVADPWVRGGTAGVKEVTAGDHAECADGRERARLRTAQRVLAAAVVHDLALGPARQVDVPFEDGSRRAGTVTGGAVSVKCTQVEDSLACGTLGLALGAAGAAAEGRACVSTAAAAFAAVRRRDGALIIEVAGVEAHHDHTAEA